MTTILVDLLMGLYYTLGLTEWEPWPRGWMKGNEDNEKVLMLTLPLSLVHIPQGMMGWIWTLSLSDSAWPALGKDDGLSFLLGNCTSSLSSLKRGMICMSPHGSPLPCSTTCVNSEVVYENARTGKKKHGVSPAIKKHESSLLLSQSHSHLVLQHCLL